MLNPKDLVYKKIQIKVNVIIFIQKISVFKKLSIFFSTTKIIQHYLMSCFCTKELIYINFRYEAMKK